VPDGREERERELDVRLRALNDRLDRYFAFQLPIGASLETRVENLERQVTSLRRFLVFLALSIGQSRMQSLERLERALDQAEARGGGGRGEPNA
jgi:hypothetical protein